MDRLLRACVALVLFASLCFSTAQAQTTFLQLPTGNPLSGVAWCSGRFVAVGDFGVVETSVDGVQWLPSLPIRSSGYLQHVTCNSHTIVAVGDSGRVQTSADAIAWTQQSTGTNDFFYGVAASPSLFVAVGGSSGGVIFTSPDGVAWTSRANTAQNPLQAVVWTGTQFVAISRFGEALTSSDGVTWTLHSMGTSNAMFGLAWSGSRLVAVGSITVLASTDGATWTPASFPFQGQLNGVAWSGSQFIAVGQVPANNPNMIFTSPDGSTWTARNAGVVNVPLHAIAVSPTTQVAVGGTGGYTLGVSATDGQNWSLRMLGTASSLHTAVALHNVFVVAGDHGTIQYSRDSLTWLPAVSPTTQSLLGSATSPTTLVLVGANGTILESQNGTTWTDHSFATADSLQAAAWSGTQFVAVGSAGIVLTSPDATTWTQRNSGTTASLTGVTWTGTQFVASGRGGVMIASSDGVSWTAFPSPGTMDLTAVTQGQFSLATVSTNSVFYESYDHGVTWSHQQMQSGLSQPLYGVGWNTEQQTYLVAASFGAWYLYATTWENVAGPGFSGVTNAVARGGRMMVGNSGVIFADTDAVFFDGFQPQ